jgi:hypothetical protein
LFKNSMLRRKSCGTSAFRKFLKGSSCMFISGPRERRRPA